ncbi:MAG: YdhR family protein [Candidatus Latescibacterota bacterium]|jgi:hypothetical protein
MANPKHPQVLLIVRFKSSLTAQEPGRRYKERSPQYQASPGLIQKYYVHDASTEEWGGLYLWDSQKSLDEFMASELRETIAETYEFVGSPRIETPAVVDVLRP